MRRGGGFTWSSCDRVNFYTKASFIEIKSTQHYSFYTHGRSAQSEDELRAVGFFFALGGFKSKSNISIRPYKALVVDHLVSDDIAAEAPLQQRPLRKTGSG